MWVQPLPRVHAHAEELRQLLVPLRPIGPDGSGLHLALGASMFQDPVKPGVQVTAFMGLHTKHDKSLYLIPVYEKSLKITKFNMT